MAKRTQPPAETPPDLTKKQGQQALSVMKAKAERLQTQRPISEEAYSTWSNSVFEYIKKTFGSLFVWNIRPPAAPDFQLERAGRRVGIKITKVAPHASDAPIQTD